MPEPVTLFISRQVKPGKEEQILAWARGIKAASQAFPGYLDSQILDQHDADGPMRLDVVVHFDSCDSLAQWEASDTRNQWYEKLEGLIEDQRMSRLEGYEPWFPPQPALKPTKWKMWVMTFLCVYPAVNLVLYALGPFLPESFPLWARLLISVPIVSLIMAFYIMPFLSRVFHKWLYPDI
ncbi:MAG: hypothetical protein AAGA45_07405 [Verrucomicrobiota bacterium]